MERNWLIRTSQNQILGPVAKQKLLEFVQKGALGMLDEVSSGNGYWFSLKEKDLVEKYLHGDLPQGYNPISESKSVVSRKDNPDKTTSINTAPANSTQIIKLDLTAFNKPTATPAASDLEMPELAAPVKKAPVKEIDTKLPTNDDLEFPDVAFIANSVNESFKNGDGALESQLTSAKIPMPIPKPAHAMTDSEKQAAAASANEEVILPNDDDLAFPDMELDLGLDIQESPTSPKIDKGKVDLSHQYTRTVALDVEQAHEVLPFLEEEEEENLSFEVTVVKKPEISLDNEIAHEREKASKATLDSPLKLDKVVKAQSNLEMKKERLQTAAAAASAAAPAIEDKKLLHDRKTKSSVAKGAALRDPSRENHPKDAQVEPQKRNDNYIFFILIILVLIIVAVFFYFKEILNKPLPV